MILFNKKFGIMIACSVVYFCGILFLISYIGKNLHYWLSNVLSDKLFCYSLLPVFLIGANAIDNSFHILHFSRYQSRKRAMGVFLLQQYMYALIFTCLWFSVVIFGIIFNFGSIDGVSRVELIENIICSYLTFLLIVNLTTIIKRQNIKSISTSASIIVYCFVHIERMLVSEINIYLPKDIYLLCSWGFSGLEYAWGILLSLNLICIVFIIQYSAQRDLF